MLSNLNRLLAALPFCVLICGCGSAWTIRKDEGGGIIGYQGFNSSERATKAINELIDCPGGSWKRVSDQMRSRNYQYNSVMPVTSTGSGSGYIGNKPFSYNDTNTQYVPVQETGVNVWREFTYLCTDPFKAVSTRYSDGLNEKGIHRSTPLIDPVGGGAYCKVFTTGAGACDYEDLQKCEADIKTSDETCSARK